MATFDTGPLEDVDVVAASPVHMPKGQRRRRVIVCAVLLAVLLCALTAGLVYTVQLQKAQAGLRAALSESKRKTRRCRRKTTVFRAKTAAFPMNSAAKKAKTPRLPQKMNS